MANNNTINMIENNDDLEYNTSIETGQNEGKSPLPLSTGTSSGITFQGNIRDVITPM
ncbi:unnamed protein product, partial [Allacma fusca]